MAHSTPVFLFCLILLLKWPGETRAQTANAFEWTASLHYGTLWRHTPKLTVRTGQPVWGQEWGIRLQTRGKKDWHAWQRFPAFGLALAHFRPGEQAHGDAWGMLPNLSVPLLRAPHWLAVFRLGTGLGYVTHPYDAFRNPGQNAIGSHWNNYTQFCLSASLRLSDHWRLQAGASLNHFSNGATTLPNYGVNLPSGFAGLSWSPAGIREAEFVRPAMPKRGNRHWGALAAGGLALIEYSVFDGPRYPVWTLSTTGFYQINRVNRLHGGLEYEFNRAVYEWGLRSGGFRTARAAQRGAIRLAAVAGDEFLFGPLSVQLLAGVYTGTSINQYIVNPWYSKLITRYYFPPVLHTRLRLHAGIALKAHRTTAEYISLLTGCVF